MRAFCSPVLVVLGAALFAGGCRCSEDRPYTPFGTTTALPSAESSPSAEVSAASSASAAPVVEKSVLAPAGSRSWELGGQTLAAPPGYVFNQAVRGRFGDADEAVAWLEADATDAGPRALGALWVFPGAGEPRKLVELPGFVPAGPGCKNTAALARTGPKTVTLDVRGECKGALIARAPVRALVVVAPDGEVPERMSLRVAAPAPGETLELVTTTNDRDNDGRDDLSVEVRVGKSGGTSLGAPFVWFDRPAGQSRDSTEPGKTLLRAAQRESGRAKVKKVAGDVVENVGILRRLMASVCAEGATPRVLDADANPLACGSLAGVVDALATAEVTAELTRGHVLDAFGALTRDGWYFGKTSASVRQKLERNLFDAVTPATAVVKVLEPRPLLEGAPRMSPLAFETGGGLFVLTAGGFVRTQPDGSSPEPLPAGPSRSLTVLAAPGQRFSGPVYSCDRSEVMLGLEGAPPLVTTLLSPRPGACGHAPFFATDVPPILAAGGGNVSAVVGGTAVGAPDTGASIPGSARSPNGRYLVVPTAYGLLIDGPTHQLVNLGASVPSPLALTDCVVADSGHSAA
ncbi:MAG TPA: hypothetical protein VNN72_19205, partial [Polyangiaceae bacterium]|nr:hypothetical protein [Polyangiaceae bacterium]